jgi:hypothetical protein
MEFDVDAGAMKPVESGTGKGGQDFEEVRRVQRWRELAVRTLGASFYFLAAISGLIGLLWFADALGLAKRLDKTSLIDGLVHEMLPQFAENESVRTVSTIAPSIIFTILALWLLLRTGRGLRRLEPSARWTAVLVLSSACIPPLVVFFLAVRGGNHSHAGWALVLVSVAALPAIFLAMAESSLIFSVEYRAFVRDTPADSLEHNPRSRFAIKLLMLLVIPVVTLAIIILTQ